MGPSLREFVFTIGMIAIAGLCLATIVAGIDRATLWTIEP